MKSVMLVIALAMTLWACKPANVKKVVVTIDPPHKGELSLIVHSDLKDKEGSSKTLEMDGTQTKYEFEFEGDHFVSKAILRIPEESSKYLADERDYSFTKNFYVQERFRKLNVVTEIKLKGKGKKKKGLKEFKTKVSSSYLEFVVNSQFNRFESLNCEHLVGVSSGTEQLNISFNNYENATSCDALGNMGEFDPEKIGSHLRDISAGDNYYTKAQGAQMGKEFRDEFNTENRGYLLPAGHPTSRYITKMMNKIADVSDNPTLRPKVYVINADILNAFALPGGYIYVFRGLIDAASSESQLMSVLGHEWGHVMARHGTKGMTFLQKRLGVWLLISLLADVATEKIKGKVDDYVAEIIILLGINNALYKYLGKGRENELEADRLGMQYNHKLGFTPWGIADMFQVFSEKGPSITTIERELGSTHPAHARRIMQAHFIPSFFFSGPEKDYIRTTVDFEEAQRAMRETPLPTEAEIAGWGSSATSSKKLAASFANTLAKPAHDLVDKMIRDRVSKYVNDELDIEAEKAKEAKIKEEEALRAELAN